MKEVLHYEMVNIYWEEYILPVEVSLLLFFIFIFRRWNVRPKCLIFFPFFKKKKKKKNQNRTRKKDNGRVAKSPETMKSSTMK